MVEGTGKRVRSGHKASTDRHILTLSPELDEQLDEALEIARLRTILKPVEAALGNPVAFPILFGIGALGAGLLILRFLFPSVVEGVVQRITSRPDVEKAAREIAEIIHTPLPNIPGVVDLEEFRQNLVNGTRDLLVRLWEGLAKLPPIL